jgi:hypothetical protein
MGGVATAEALPAGAEAGVVSVTFGEVELELIGGMSEK